MTRLPIEVEQLSARGARLFPLHPNSKNPILARWQLDNNSSVVDQLKSWAELYPGCNWGMLCGPSSGIFVIDVDSKNGKNGFLWLERMIDEHTPEFLDTIHVRTPSGGRHFYYRWPGFVVHKDNSGKLGEGVDVQGLGSFVVVPPSEVGGVGYVFEDSDAGSWLAEVPAWLAADLQRPARKSNGQAKPGRIHEGQRRPRLVSYAGKLFNTGMDFETFKFCLAKWNLDNCDPPLEEAEVEKQAECYHRWRLRPGAMDPEEDMQPACYGRLFSEITPRDIDWLWKPYIPKGMMTMLSGDPGAGKSFIALDIAAKQTCLDNYVLYLSVENPPEQVLIKRFQGLGGCPENIKLLEGIEYGPPGGRERRSITLQDVKALEAEILVRRPALIVIDPVQSYLGPKVDANRANETRPILDGLIQLAEKYGMAVLVLRHCSKNTTGKVIYRGLGSIDFTAAARSELIVGEHEKQMAMANMKNNLTKKGPTLGYRITELDDRGNPVETGVFVWTGECDLKPEDLVEPEPSLEETKAIRAAGEFLEEALKDGPRLARDLLLEARDAGVSEITLRRSKERIGVKVQKRLGDGRWEWFFPKMLTDSYYLDQVDLDQDDGVGGVDQGDQDQPYQGIKGG